MSGLHALKLHPDSRSDAVLGIDVDVARLSGGGLVLRYDVRGVPGRLRLPPVGAPNRTDGLWRHTCFEAFVRAVPGDAYAEFNFAPSTAWAVYRFTGHRDRMTIVREINAVEIGVRTVGGSLELRVPLNLSALAILPSGARWQLGLSAVIEETDGRLSYWALAHPPGKPDFHHSDCFALELPPASPA